MDISEQDEMIAGSHIAALETNEGSSPDDASVEAHIQKIIEINEETEAKMKFFTNKHEEQDCQIAELVKNRDEINLQIKMKELDIQEERCLRSQCNDLITSLEKQCEIITEQVQKTECGFEGCDKMVDLHYQLRNPVEQELAEFSGHVAHVNQLVEKLDAAVDKADLRINEEYAAMNADTEQHLSAMSTAQAQANALMVRLRDEGCIISRDKKWLDQLGTSESVVDVLTQLRKALTLVLDKNKALKKKNREVDEKLENTAHVTARHKDLAAQCDAEVEKFTSELRNYAEEEARWRADFLASLSAAEEADKEFQTLLNQTEPLEVAVEQLVAENQALECTCAETSQRIQQLKEWAVERSQEHQQHCQQLDQEIAQIELQKNILAGRMLELDKQLEAASLNYSEVHERVEKAEKELASIDADQLRESIDQLELKMDTALERMSKMNIPHKTSELERLIENQHRFDNEMAELETEIEKLQELIRELQVYNRERQFTRAHVMRYKNMVEENDKLRIIYMAEHEEISAELEQIELSKQREKDAIVEKGRNELKALEEVSSAGLTALADLIQNVPNEEEALLTKRSLQLKADLEEQKRISAELTGKLSAKKQRRLIRTKQKQLERKHQKKYGQELFRLQKQREQYEIEQEKLRLQKEREKIQAEQERLQKQAQQRELEIRQEQQERARKQREQQILLEQQERARELREQELLQEQQERARKQHEEDILQEQQERARQQREQQILQEQQERARKNEQDILQKQQEKARKQPEQQILQEQQEKQHSDGQPDSDYEEEHSQQQCGRDTPQKEQRQEPIIESRPMVQKQKAITREEQLHEIVPDLQEEVSGQKQRNQEIIFERQQRRTELETNSRKSAGVRMLNGTQDTPGWMVMLGDIKKENTDSPVEAPETSQPPPPTHLKTSQSQRKFFKSRRTEAVTQPKKTTPKEASTVFEFDDDDCQVTFVGPAPAPQKKSKRASSKK